MPDIIQLLPDHLANQIAAGEVIQRPASAVKELLENAIDAEATEIKLVVADAGKSLVQVIDNGKGMSTTDARMAFERHATSKISSIDDLFNLRTMGFRGEALASIAAVAQVELKSRRAEDDLGTQITIENSTVVAQEAVQCPVGTSIAMKNVFFNVPARRHFLRSNTTELRNIIDEFIRVAMAFPQVHFSMQHNGQQVYFLEKGSLKQRIVQLLGNNYNTKLVTVKEETDYLIVHGFVAKPDMARKTRGDQYFFVNNRYIRSAYLHHALVGAFSDLIPKDSHPAYVLHITLDPAELDINVHPTKQEIKFTDEKIVYAFVQAAVKHALAQFSIAPSLDFSLNANIQELDAIQKPSSEETVGKTMHSNLYQTFTQKNQAHTIPANPSWQQAKKQTAEIQTAIKSQTDSEGLDGWMSELAKLKATLETPAPKAAYTELEYEGRPKSDASQFKWLSNAPLVQINKTYIIAPTTTGYMIVHQQYAHERVVYEQLQQAIFNKPVSVQQSLFPATMQLSAADALLLNELMPDLDHLGYRIAPQDDDTQTFSLLGTPADVEVGDEQRAIEKILDQFKHFSSDVKFSKREKLIRTLAWQQAIKPGRQLQDKEMQSLLDQLFACKTPNVNPSGKPTYVSYTLPQLDQIFS